MWSTKCCRFLAMISGPRHASATFWRTLCRRVLASFAVPTFVRGAGRCMIMQLRIHMTMALHISRATRWRHLCLRVTTSAYLYALAWSHLCASVYYDDVSPTLAARASRFSSVCAFTCLCESVAELLCVWAPVCAISMCEHSLYMAVPYLCVCVPVRLSLRVGVPVCLCLCLCVSVWAVGRCV